MEIRLYQKGDSKQVVKLLQGTVNIVDTQSYAEIETESGMLDHGQSQDWESFFLDSFTIVAEINSTIVGVAQIEDDGHINCFYCHSDFRRQGIGGQLYTALEDYAKTKRIPTIYSETSSSDRPFFLQMGFEEVQKQKVLIGGKVPTHFVIKKDLPS